MMQQSMRLWWIQSQKIELGLVILESKANKSCRSKVKDKATWTKTKSGCFFCVATYT